MTLHEPVQPGRQLTFEFAHEIGMRLADFMPAPSNREAYDLVMAWPVWPVSTVVLCGPEGSGRTHLARIWAERARAIFFDAAEIWEQAEPLKKLGDQRALVVDDADRILSERYLFHIFNMMAERRGMMLLTAETAPSRWRVHLPDLRSRLQAALPVAIEPPCDDLLAALLVKQFADLQVRIDPAVVTYLVRHMERSFTAVRRLIIELDRVSLCAQRPITMPLARSVLEQIMDARADDSDQHEQRGLGPWI